MNNSKTNSFAKTQHHVDKPHLFREIVRTYQTLMALFSRKSGVPASLFSLMRILAVADDDIGVMDLSGRLGIDAAAITRQVQKLERERLIHRHGDPEDGRRSYVSLTPKGQRMFDDIHERSHEFERSLLSAIGAKEMANAVEVLAKLRDFLSGLR